MTDNAIHLLLVLALIYLAPTVIALLRLRRDTLSILIINAFLGWTFVAWVLMLARSVSPKRA